MNTSDGRRRRRTHSSEFKVKVVAACRRPGVSIAAVALANGLNANLLRRWVVTEEQAQRANAIDTVSASAARLEAPTRSFIPLQLEAPVIKGEQPITVELRRGTTVVKLAWPQSAAAECAAWLRELLR